MASLFHRSRQRRAERAPVTAHGNINLVPLVDILTSIVFFSLLTYQGATMLALTSFDLSLPPIVVNSPEQAAKAGGQQLTLLIAVRVDPDKLTVEHTEEGGFHQVIPGLDSTSLNTLQALMTQIHQKFPQNNDVTVIPSDQVSYANVIHVLERLKMANFSGISLSTHARAATPAPGA